MRESTPAMRGSAATPGLAEARRTRSITPPPSPPSSPPLLPLPPAGSRADSPTRGLVHPQIAAGRACTAPRGAARAGRGATGHGSGPSSVKRCARRAAASKRVERRRVVRRGPRGARRGTRTRRASGCAQVSTHVEPQRVVDAEVRRGGCAAAPRRGSARRRRARPRVPVGRSGSAWPLTSTAWRSGTRPSARTSMRSTERVDVARRAGRASAPRRARATARSRCAPRARTSPASSVPDDRAAQLDERPVRLGRQREPARVEEREHVLEVAPQPVGQEEAIVQRAAPAHERRRGTARRRTRRPARGRGSSARPPCAGAAASRTRAARRGPAGRAASAGRRACRCRSRRGGCCPRRRRAGGGTACPRATAAAGSPGASKARAQRDLQLVERVVARLVDARRLRRRARRTGRVNRYDSDGWCWTNVMRLGEQIGPAQEGALQRRRAAEREVVAAAAARPCRPSSRYFSAVQARRGARRRTPSPSSGACSRAARRAAGG